MSLPVLLGFAGVLVAAVVTGLLAGKCARQPRMGFIAWTGTTLALTAALAAESTGFASGFGSATFRAVQLFALLLAPLWAAWGLAELLWPNEAARFGARLVCGALTVIGSVILATDPLTAQSFGKSWPPAGRHYQPPSHYVLDAAQAVAVIIAVTTVGLAVVRATNDRQRRGALAGAALVGLAVLILVAQRFSLSARSLYPLIGTAAAALVWFGAVVLDKPAGRAGRDRPDRQAGRGRRDGREARDREPAGYENQVAANGYRGPDSGGSHPPGDPGEAGRADPARRPAVLPGAGPGADQAGAVAEFGAPAQLGGSPAASSRPYGRILIFTLLDDRVADFDRFAEQAAEEVRGREPGTLVYVIHLVPNAPMQRIFYEIFRDREAFDHHERQPYMQRFVAERRSCVLATNVIELRLKYAKVAPLPNPQPPVAAGSQRPAAQPPPGQPPRQPPGQPSSQPPGQPPPGTRRAQALEPLPPGPPGPSGQDRRMPSAGRRHGGS